MIIAREPIDGDIATGQTGDNLVFSSQIHFLLFPYRYHTLITTSSSSSTPSWSYLINVLTTSPLLRDIMKEWLQGPSLLRSWKVTRTPNATWTATESSKIMTFMSYRILNTEMHLTCIMSEVSRSPYGKIRGQDPSELLVISK